MSEQKDPRPLMIYDVFRWSRFPFEMDRFNCLIVYDRSTSICKENMIKKIKDISPLEVVKDYRNSDGLTEEKSLNNFNTNSSKFKLKLDYMTRPYANANNTHISTSIIDISSVDKKSLKILDDAVLGNTHVIATVMNDKIIENFYEMFDMIIFVNPDHSTRYIESRFKRLINLKQVENISEKMIIIDTTQELDNVSFLAKI